MVHEADDRFLSLVLKVIKESSKEISDPNELSKIIKETISKTLPEAAKALLKTLKSSSKKMLEERRSYSCRFEERLFKRWKKPIDLLEMLLAISYEVGDEFNSKYREEACKTNDYVFDALTRLHARGCQIGFEILALLKSGLADGAHARWRTLHEIAVISFFITEHGQSIAERFIHFEVIEAYKAAIEYQKHCHELGYKPLTKKELQWIKKMRDNVIKTYGRDFGKSYGWVPKNMLSKRNFAEIEKSVKLDKFRPHYRLACHIVHSGSIGIKFSLGLVQDSSKSPIILAGPSNYGLADPGQGMAISLVQVTTCLLTIRPTLERLITIRAMQKLVDEICLAFCEVQSQIKEEEKRMKQNPL